MLSTVSGAALLAEAGAQLGLAVSNLVTLLNPELVLVCGEGTALGEPFLGPMIEAVRAATFGGLGRELTIKVQEWGNEAWSACSA